MIVVEVIVVEVIVEEVIVECVVMGGGIVTLKTCFVFRLDSKDLRLNHPS